MRAPQWGPASATIVGQRRIQHQPAECLNAPSRSICPSLPLLAQRLGGAMPGALPVIVLAALETPAGHAAFCAPGIHPGPLGLVW